MVNMIKAWYFLYDIQNAYEISTEEGVPLYMGNQLWQFNRMVHVVDDAINGDGRIRDFTLPDGKILRTSYPEEKFEARCVVQRARYIALPVLVRFSQRQVPSGYKFRETYKSFVQTIRYN